ncbi:MAG: hypothetical protein ACK5WZ_05095 [Pseudobdellovibrionaceae bacterium]
MMRLPNDIKTILFILFFSFNSFGEMNPATSAGRALVGPATSNSSAAGGAAAAIETPSAASQCMSDVEHEEAGTRYQQEIVDNINSIGMSFPRLKETLNRFAQRYTNSRESCGSRSVIAMHSCQNCRSQYIQNAVNIGQTALGTLGGLGSVTGQCSGIENAAKMIQAALGLYQVACGGAKAACDWSCSDAKTGLEQLRTGVEQARQEMAVLFNMCVNGPPDKPVTSVRGFYEGGQCSTYANTKEPTMKAFDNIKTAIAAELSASNAGSIAKRFNICQGYTTTLLSAVSGIASYANLSARAKQCKKATQASAPQPQDKCAPLPGKTVIETTLDNTCLASLCSKTEYSARSECVCYTAPRTPGCNNGLTPAGNDVVNSLQGMPVDPNTASLRGNGITNSTGGNGNSVAAAQTRTAAGTDGRAAGLSGDGAGSPTNGLGAGASGLSQEVAPSAISRPSTSMYSSESGGSGGFGSGSYGSGSGSGGLRAYLPGGAQDPARMAASVPASGVTSAGGKSNFEKITDRYVESRSSLNPTGR